MKVEIDYVMNGIRGARKLLYYTGLWFKYLLAIGIVLCGVTVISYEMMDFENDTLKMSYYGFAVMIAYASICFSWARNVEKDNQVLTERLNQIAIKSLYTAVVFMLGSFFKYALSIKGSVFTYGNPSHYYYLPMTISAMCLIYAVFYFCILSLQIMARFGDYFDADFAKFIKEIDDKIKEKQSKKEIEVQPEITNNERN